MSSWYSFLCCWSALFAASLLGVDPANAQPSKIELPSSYTDFAMNPEDGSVCCVDSANNEVVVLSAEYFRGDKSKNSDPISVANKPCCVTFKQFGEKKYFVVSCFVGDQIYVIDAETHQVSFQVPHSVRDIVNLIASSNPDDPFVYYVHGNYNTSTGAINLRDRVDRYSHGAKMLAIADDGKSVFTNGRGSSQNTAVAEMFGSFGDDKPMFSSSKSSRGFDRMFEQILPGPFGEYVVADRYVRSRRSNMRAILLEGKPACFMRNSPFLVCFNDGLTTMNRNKKSLRLYCVSTNNFERVGEMINLAEFLKDEEPEPKNPRVRASVTKKERFLLDEKNGWLLIAERNRVLKVNLADLKLPDQIFLRITNENLVLKAGEEQTIEFKTSHPEIQIEVDKLPRDSSLKGNLLTWTPSIVEVGSNKIEVQLKMGDVQRVQHINVDVYCPYLDLPDYCTKIEMSPTGSTAVAWQAKPEGRYVQAKRKEYERAAAPKLFLIDLDQMKLVAERQLPFRVEVLKVDEHYCYVSSAESNYCEVLDKKTLETVKTIYVDAKTINFDNQSVRLGYSTFSLPELEPTETVLVTEAAGQIWRRQYFGNVNPTYYSGPSRGITSRKMPTMGIRINPWRTRNIDREFGLGTQYVENVGVDIFGSNPRNQIATINLSEIKGNRNEVTELIRRATPSYSIHQKTVWILVGNRILQWNVSDEDFRGVSLPKEMKFTGKREWQMADGETTEIDLEVVNGEGPIQYGLLGQYTGVEIHDGKLIIDNGKWLEGLEKSCEFHFRGKRSGDYDKFRQRLEDYETRLVPPVQKIIGANFDKLPVAQDIRIRAQDSKTQMCEISLTIVYGLQKSKVLTFLTTGEKNQQMKSAEAEAARKNRQERLNAASKIANLDSLKADVDQLSTRLDRLAEQMDEILKLLEEKDKD